MRFLPRLETGEISWVVLPVPYEETTRYLHGTAGGPAAILEASARLAVYDAKLKERTRARVGIHPAEEGD